MLTVGCIASYAQDVIVKNDGTTVLCKIIGVNNTEVIYSKWSDVNGPQYIMDRSLVSNINYQDGRQDKLNEQTSNAYAPGIQQSGEANYNDKALLALDAQRHGISPYLKNLKKAKNLRIIGWSVGPTLAVGGAIIMIIRSTYNWGDDEVTGYLLGGGLILAGVATTTGCLIKANQYAKKAQTLASMPVFQHEFKLSDGSSLCAGIDMIRDKRLHQSTFGLGFQYNF